MPRTLKVLAVTVVALVLAPAPALAQPAEGTGLAQLADENGCVAQGAEGCAAGRGLLGAAAAAVSPDGKNVYVAAWGSGAVSVFSRDGESGALTQTGCVSHNGTNGRDGTDGECLDGSALAGAGSVAISPDGRSVYVTAERSNGIAVFARDPNTGALTQTGCVRNIATCTNATPLRAMKAIVVSPDGRNVYATSGLRRSESRYAGLTNAVVTFDRDAASGALTKTGCTSDDGTDGVCVDGMALRGADAIAISPDGKNVYATAALTGAVLTFARDTATGALTQRACSMDAAPQRGPCTDGKALSGTRGLAVSPDGSNVYAVGAQGLAVFDRNGDTGALSQTACIQEDPEPVEEDVEDEEDLGDEDDTGDEEGRRAQGGGDCARVPLVLDDAKAVAVSPDGRRVYVTAGWYPGAVSVFARDRDSGALAPLGCLTTASEYGLDYRRCATARALVGPEGVAVSPDGANVYVAAFSDDAVAVFRAAVAVSGRPVTATRRGFARIRLSCPAAKAGGCAGTVGLVQPKGVGRRAARALTSTSGFGVRAGRIGVVAVRLSPRARRLLASRGAIRVLAVAREAGGATEPVTRTFTLRFPRR